MRTLCTQTLRESLRSVRTDKSIAFVLESVSAAFLLGKERAKDTEAAFSFPENSPHVKLHREERGKKKEAFTAIRS